MSTSVGAEGEHVASDGHALPQAPRKSRKAGIGALLALVLLVNLAASLYQLPLNRVVERRLCREHYLAADPSVIDRDGSVDETLCKIDSVQQRLAWIQGTMETAWIVGDFVMTIPLGFLAERYGRRTILSLNLVPRIFMLAWAVLVGYFEQALPTKAIVASPFLSVLGADCVFNSITYAIASSMTDDHVESYVLTSLASSDTKLLVQYISKRYHWTFASTGYLLSAKAVVNFTLLTIIIPALLRSRRNASRHLSPELASHRMNMYYANVCLIVSVLGALAISVATSTWMLVPSLFLYALGSALPVFTLSLLKSPFIAPKRNEQQLDTADPDSHIFSIVMMVKTSGSLLGAPLMMRTAIY
ncbi:hypothetical protein K4K56_009840 [Colletotrichum sp. SAR 10_98]|nr:hypothetical protein K4K56_009840 [Colletotrichum sp. SAR 10_98]